MNIKLFLTVLSVCKIWAKGVTITSSCLTTQPKPLLPTILYYDSQIKNHLLSWIMTFLDKSFFGFCTAPNKILQHFFAWYIQSIQLYTYLQSCGIVVVAFGLLCVWSLFCYWRDLKCVLHKFCEASIVKWRCQSFCPGRQQFESHENI